MKIIITVFVSVIFHLFLKFFVVMFSDFVFFSFTIDAQCVFFCIARIAKLRFAYVLRSEGHLRNRFVT